ALRIFRASDEIGPKAWKRKKARELFAILVTQRGALCQKEWLMETLWPDASMETADRDFRVALHAVSDALDPDRPRNAPARWIERRDTGYGLCQASVDAQEFAGLVEQARRAREPEAAQLREQALNLYRGDYLEDYPYADWAQA